MKLVFQKNDQGIALGFVECMSTEEADKFLDWFAAKQAPSVPRGVASAEVIKAEEAPAAAEAEKPANEPVPQETKVTKSSLSQAAIALVQSKGRDALTPILNKYSAKRISEIREDDYAVAFADIQQAQGAA